MKKKTLLNDDSISTVSLDGMNLSELDISTVAVIEDSGKIRKVVLPIIFTVLACALITAAILFVINFKIVQGDIYGATFTTSNISVVSNDYRPTTYIVKGAAVYYDSDSDDAFVNMEKDFTIANVVEVNDGKVLVEDQSGKQQYISTTQVDYVARGL